MTNTKGNTKGNTEDKKKRVRHTSPKGESLFSHIIDIDYGTKDYPDKEGSYNITLRLNAADAEKLKASIADELEEAVENMEACFAELKPASRKQLGQPTFIEPGTEEYERDTEEPTGNYLFRFKTRAHYEDRQGRKRDRHVPVFDAFQSPVKLKEEPGFGSVVRVAFTAVPYFVDATGRGGLSLYLDAVQIIKLNRMGERSASDYGFAAEEDGFSADTIADEDVVEESSTASVSGSEDGGVVNADDVPF